ncbi:efflux RND transporter periplasmic adaptor subunit [uncultured Ilyobacter sp.]|uniref:efflux RND transporter periplasmic adaptor subunit n=1 Tax=uncultured Ilyobacter sp. TaxID=544433 RepID=UPI0029C928A7|nr:efflux RND transporter periplasmic adaptor subunit [uncultured Ilyobacter sp.]
MKLKKAVIIAVVLILVITGFILYKKTFLSEETKRSYSVYKVKRADFEKIVEADGIIEARDTKLIYADRSLKVDKVYYSEGDYVKIGETIMTFDPEDKNSVMRDLKKEEISLKKLRRDLENKKELFKIGGASKVEVENLQFDIETSLLKIEDFKEELSKMLDEIKSPFNGTIISMIAEENYRVNTEVELFEIADLSDMIIVADVPEYSINEISLGQPVRIAPEAYKELFKGEVSKISTLSTATSSNSSNQSSSSSSTTEAYVEVEITLDNIPAQLRPGFNVKAEIITYTNRDSISIPRMSVLEDKKGYYVFELQSDSTIKKKYVTLKLNNSSVVSVEGLDENVTIIKDPDQSLVEGIKVKVGVNDSQKNKKA